MEELHKNEMNLNNNQNGCWQFKTSKNILIKSSSPINKSTKLFNKLPGKSKDVIKYDASWSTQVFVGCRTKFGKLPYERSIYNSDNNAHQDFF